MKGFSRKRRNALRLVAVALAAALTGCAAPKSALLPELNDWNDRQQVLAGLDEWQFSGRIAVKTATDGFNGKLRWSQDRDAYEATASGPLGAGAVRIEGNGASVVLTDKDGVRTELEDAELEFRLRYGWTIPVQSLRYWALGVPDPAAYADTVIDDAGRLSSLRQRDWSVTFSRYADGGGQMMPKVLTAENADTRVRLVIDHWIFFD
ncbi:MAG: lipoprotein insertase outer membrane protein LolB [Woeseiaceae bacterium]|nr:lipoprotein insertase outer membrane protein LolB [Woeseiaceae bacterium]